MERGKKLYFGILVVVTLLVTTLCFSYAFFVDKKEGHGKLNIIAGTLDYKIESNVLVNNQVEVEPNDNLEFTLTITSLNKMSSKYELYYTLSKNIEDVEVGYSNETKDSTQGIIKEKGTKEIKVVIKNHSKEKIKVTFGVHGGLETVAYDDITKYGMRLKEASIDDLVLAYTYTGKKEKPTKFPNKGEGYLVDSVSCTGADGVWNEAEWGVKLSNITSKTIYCNATIKDEIPEVYGDTIQDSYPNIYTNFSPTEPIIGEAIGNEKYVYGNFAYPVTLSHSLFHDSLSNDFYFSPTSLEYYNIRSATPRCSYKYNFSPVLTGMNTYTLEKEINGRWVYMLFSAAWGTTGVSISDFKLKFKDDSSLTLEQAINQKYIEPLVIITTTNYLNSSYVWSDFYNSMLSGGPTLTTNYPNGQLFFKVTEKSAFVGYQLTSNVDWFNGHDGIMVVEFSEDAKISTQPLK